MCDPAVWLPYVPVGVLIVQALGLGATLILLFLTLRHNQHVEQRTSIELIEPRANTEDCSNTPLGLVNTFYFKLRVVAGAFDASNVEVFGRRLQRYESGDWVDVEKWLPTNFVWRAEQNPPAIVQVRIPARSTRWCHFGRVVDPALRRDVSEKLVPDDGVSEPLLSLLLADIGFKQNHLYKPGRYRLQLEVTASNAPAVVRVLEVDMESAWSPDWRTMAEKHLRFSLSNESLGSD